MSLNVAQERLHLKALRLARRHRALEGQMIQVLGRIDRQKIFRKLGFASLFRYCVEELGLTESVSYHFIAVARKCVEVRELACAVVDGRLSVSKASRIVPAINAANASHLIAFARTHSSRETDFEAARIQGHKGQVRDRARVVAEDLIRLELGVSEAVYDRLLRAQDLLSSKTGRPAGFAEVLDRALGEYLERHDPVLKADRAQKRKEKPAAKIPRPAAAPPADAKLRPNRVRKPLPAATRHAVFARDGGRCTFIEPSGKRCAQERWLDVHHIVPLHAGGSDDPENLTTLCGPHHDLIHQLSLPLEEPVSWFSS